ncbi:MAG: hypothetical protein WB492_15025 [Christiangramia sp.]
MKKLICFISLVAIISCKTEQDAEDSLKNKQDTTAFQKKIKIQDPDFALEPEARKYALNWVEYITAQNEISKLEDATINEVMNNAPTIAQIMGSLKTSIPDSLKAVPVEARLNVINTKAQLLKQYSGKQKPDAEAIQQTAKELHQEFSNLKLQMNELFLKTIEDFEKELDEIERKELEEKEQKEKDTL